MTPRYAAQPSQQEVVPESSASTGRRNWAGEKRAAFNAGARTSLIDRQWAREASQHDSPASRSVP